MHLPFQISKTSKIKHPPWSTIRIIGENISRNEESENNAKETHDVLFLDSKQFVVQTLGDKKSQKVFSRFGVLDIVKDDIIQIFPSYDRSQSSLSKIY